LRDYRWNRRPRTRIAVTVGNARAEGKRTIRALYSTVMLSAAKQLVAPSPSHRQSDD
jgi:hypothetical protein